MKTKRAQFYSIPAYGKLVGQSLPHAYGPKIVLWVVDGKVYQTPHDNKAKGTLLSDDWTDYCNSHRATNITERTVRLFHID